MISPLILPGTLEYELTLGHCIPPDWKAEADRLSGQFAFIASSDTGLLRPCSAEELEDYIEGGEYEERLRNSGQDDLLEVLIS